MELQSPYLQAIQCIAGKVPGEKYKELNLIAKRHATNIRSNGDPTVIAEVDNVPWPLVPLVQLEIANILRQNSVVVEALKSEDIIIVNRAMKMNWFFSTDNKEIINVAYIDKNLLPHVSLDTRIQLIKRLAINFNKSGDTEIAEKFYTFFATKYGKQQAEPLLLVCGESFIHDTVVANKIVLSSRMLRILFRYPELVIRYLKLSNPEDKPARDSYKVDINRYRNFLPRLIKKHPSAFIELLEMHDSTLGIRLSKKAAERLLKTNLEAFLNKPKLYTCLMPMEVVAAKLTKPQYEAMFVKLLPEQKEKFHYQAVKDYLEYYPKHERLSLIIDAYRKAYDENFLDNTDAMDVQFMCMLPTEERVRQVRLKLAKPPGWYSDRETLEGIWRNYLPTAESIPAIKADISKSTNPDDRSGHLVQMFWSCKINDDKDALLEVLRYFTTRHKNEQSFVLFEVLEELFGYFNFATDVGNDHWAVLDEFIQFLRVKDELNKQPDVSRKVLVAGVHFNLIHDLPIEDKMAMILEMNMEGDEQKWSLLERHPEYDRRCFETFLSMIPEKYPKDHEVWEDKRWSVITSIVRSMNTFNARNAKIIAANKISKLSIRNCPWLLESVKEIVQSTDNKLDADGYMQSLLKTHDKDLYDEWVPTERRPAVAWSAGKALLDLAKQPQEILDKWEEYLKRARSIVNEKRARRFFRTARWHQKIPTKFLKGCLNNFSKSQDANSLIVLGILMKGDEFARVIEPHVPKVSKIDTANENAKSTYKVIDAIPKAMNRANPPVPLDLVLSFCEGDYVNVGLSTLTNTCRRVSVEKIENFTKTLVGRHVTVRKHGVRLFCLVASLDDFREFLKETWNTENHRSVRAIIFAKIYRLFIDDSNPDTWAIMKNCIADLKVNDDDALEKLMNFCPIPDRYIADYVKLLVETLEKLEASGFSEAKASQHVCRILRSIGRDTTGSLLPEDFCEQLLRKYFLNPSLKFDTSSDGNEYAVHGYLLSAGERLESRLKVLCELFEANLRKYWNVPHPNASSFFPINYLAHNFMTDPMLLKGDVRIMKSILKSFLAVLKPQCDYEAYAMLAYGIALKDAKGPEEIVAKIGETLPGLVDVLSSEMVVFLADVVKRWLKILVEWDKLNSVLYDLMESLCVIGTDHACLLAAKILFDTEKQPLEDRRNKITEVLQKSGHPAVVSLVYLHANTKRFPG